MENLEGFQNSIRLNLLLNEATRVLRQVFREQYNSVTGKNWTDGPFSAQDFIDTVGKKYFKSSQKIQKGLLKAGNVDQWDLAMLCNILTTTSLKVEMRKTAILELRDIRNKLAHLGDFKSSSSVSGQEFPDLWNKSAGIVISLGGDAVIVEKIRSASNISGIEFKNVEGALAAENQEIVAELKNKGNSAVKAGEWGKAVTFYSQALNLFGVSDVERAILYSNRSLAHLKTVKRNQHLKESCDKEAAEKSKDAFDDARSCIELRPNWWKGYARVGQVFHWRKEWATAVLFYDMALSLSPDKKEIVAARDECRFEGKAEAIEENQDPLLRPSSQAELLTKNKRTKGGKSGKAAAKELDKMSKKCMKSKVPKERAWACVSYGHLYKNGVDALLDYAKAVGFFSKAAELGNAEGMYNLGSLHQQGLGVSRDFGKAVQLFEQAAAKPPMDPFTKIWDIGVAAAEYGLGRAFEDGVGKPIDYKEAARWYHKASKHGVSNADNNLGFMYKQGRGVKMDLDKAIQFWELAASRKNALAMHPLAWEYLLRGDVKKAQMWYQRSIEWGNGHAVLDKKNFDEAVKFVESGGQTTSSPLDLPFQFPSQSQSIPGSAAVQRELPETAEIASQAKPDSDDNDCDDDDKFTATAVVSIRHEHQLTNPNRLQIVVKFREMISSQITARRTGLKPVGEVVQTSLTARALTTQKAPLKLSSLKDIKLDEMDPNTDHVYEGTVINLTIVEDPIMNHFPSVHTVVRDENWNVSTCYFYNLDREEDRREKFKFGTQFSITNPYHRLTALELTHGIKVDDPNSVIFHGRDENLCRFCWKEVKEGEKTPCVGCKRVLYCDKKCKEQDCKLLKHKLVCDPQLLQKL